jgi:hypothetical protein
MQRRRKRFGEIGQQILPLRGNVGLRQQESGGLAHRVMDITLLLMNLINVIVKIP